MILFFYQIDFILSIEEPVKISSLYIYDLGM